MNFIDKVIKEATLQKDLVNSSIAKNIMIELGKKLNSYHGEDINNEIEYSEKYEIFFTKINDLKIYIFGKNSNHSVATHAKSIGREGGYSYKDSTLYLFNCFLYYNQVNNKLEYHLNPQVLYHELIHYLDYKSTDISKIKDKKIKDAESVGKEYYNDSFELNAHFMDKIMPEIEELLSNDKSVFKLIKEKGFSFFKNVIFQKREISEYFKQLTEKNQKRFLKRLADYYQKITNG